MSFGGTGGLQILYFQLLRYKGKDLVPKGAEQLDTTRTHNRSPLLSKAYDRSPPLSEAHDRSPLLSEAHYRSPLPNKAQQTLLQAILITIP